MKSWLRGRRLRHNDKESPATSRPSAGTADVSNRSNIILASDVADHGAMAEVWAQQTAESVLQRSQVNYRTKAEEEFINIQQRARQLEHMMLHYHAEHVTPRESNQSIIASKSIRTLQATPADLPITTRSRSLSDVTDTLYKTTTPTAKYREIRPSPPRRTLSSGVVATDLSTKNGGLKRPDPDLPHICIYCKRGFATLTMALRLHPVCTVWSCRFLPGIQYAIYPTEVNGKLQALCCYCNESLGHEKQGRVKSSLLRGHMRQHNFRNCDPVMYYSGQSFRQHLQDEHKAINDGTLFTAWMLLLKSSQRSQPSFFEQSESSPATLRAQTDPGFNSKESSVDKIRATPTNFMELTEDNRRAEPNKLRRKRSATTLSEQRIVQDAGDIPSVPPLPQHRLIQSPPPTSQSDASGQWSAIQGYNAGLVFYRRRIDASMRNRLYLHNGDEPLPESSQQLFRRINGSVLGGLILHSSLIAAVPVRMTNSVDIYQV